jgi:hypothetical protein
MARPIREIELTVDQFRELLPKLRPYLEACAAVTRGEYLADHIIDEVLAGRARAYAVLNVASAAVMGCVVLRDAANLSARVLELWVVAGRDFHTWARSFSRSIESRARRQGYTRIDTVCIPRLVPHLESCGMVPAFVHMIKEL